MKRGLILLLLLAIGILTMGQPAFAAVVVNPGDSLWVRLDGATAPADFDGMTLFWGLEPWSSKTGANLDYYIYGPTGYAGGSTPNDPLQAPSIVDLSIFKGQDVVFEFRNLSTGGQIFTFKNPIAVNDLPPVINGEAGAKNLEFYYAFYDGAVAGWPTREAIQYTAGLSSTTAPAHGNQFYSHDLFSAVDDRDPTTLTTLNIRSDFQSVPVPGTLLLFASGIVALAGGRKMFTKK